MARDWSTICIPNKESSADDLTVVWVNMYRNPNGHINADPFVYMHKGFAEKSSEIKNLGFDGCTYLGAFPVELPL